MNKNSSDEKVEIFCKFIVRKGKKIYPSKGKVFHFYVQRKPAA